jgi:hypothetical protein
MKVSSNIIGVCQVQKRNRERKEVKRNKRKERDERRSTYERLWRLDL